MIEERLLICFRGLASHRGVVTVRGEVLAKEVEASLEDVGVALKKLERAGLIEVLAPLPFLVIRIQTWSGGSSPHAAKGQQISSSSSPLHKEVPVSSRAAAATQPEDGGAGEGEARLDRVLAVLGPEADRDEFRTILAGHHPALIHRCLRRVEATKTFRVSRAALFRSLLQKLAR
jgi:SOS-response transcriptional repressor LexA